MNDQAEQQCAKALHYVLEAMQTIEVMPEDHEGAYSALHGACRLINLAIDELSGKWK